MSREDAPRRLPVSFTVPELPDDPAVRDLTLALNYRCNNRCRFCFIEPEIGAAPRDTERELVYSVFEKNGTKRSFERIIFSGAEATLRKDLPELVSDARRVGGFSHVRIQTNGRAFADRGYAEKLVGAGLDELFVSIHAPTADLDAHVTGVGGNFAQMRRGVKNAHDLGARVISNTCVTNDNYRALPDLARFLVDEGLRESELWAFIEFGSIGQQDQHVRFTEAMPYLHEAVSILRTSIDRVSLSWFPECMLGPHADRVENHRAFTLILDDFARRMHAHAGFDCPHASACPRFGKSCVGLHERYRELFGDERENLTAFDRPRGVAALEPAPPGARGSG